MVSSGANEISIEWFLGMAITWLSRPNPIMDMPHFLWCLRSGTALLALLSSRCSGGAWDLLGAVTVASAPQEFQRCQTHDQCYVGSAWVAANQCELCPNYLFWDYATVRIPMSAEKYQVPRLRACVNCLTSTHIDVCPITHAYVSRWNLCRAPYNWGPMKIDIPL